MICQKINSCIQVWSMRVNKGQGFPYPWSPSGGYIRRRFQGLMASLLYLETFRYFKPINGSCGVCIRKSTTTGLGWNVFISSSKIVTCFEGTIFTKLGVCSISVRFLSNYMSCQSKTSASKECITQAAIMMSSLSGAPVQMILLWVIIIHLPIILSLFE